MEKMQIEIPKGYQIDTDKSDLSKGVIKFKKIKINLPKKWEDIKYLDGSYVDDDSRAIPVANRDNEKYNRNIFKTYEQAKASLALAQLSQLREIYRQGWKPDWEDNKTKYCIEYTEDNRLVTVPYANYNRFLSFQSQEIRDEFLENFKDLIEQARPLMS